MLEETHTKTHTQRFNLNPSLAKYSIQRTSLLTWKALFGWNWKLERRCIWCELIILRRNKVWKDGESFAVWLKAIGSVSKHFEPNEHRFENLFALQVNSLGCPNVPRFKSVIKHTVMSRHHYKLPLFLLAAKSTRSCPSTNGSSVTLGYFYFTLSRFRFFFLLRNVPQMSVQCCAASVQMPLFITWNWWNWSLIP